MVEPPNRAQPHHFPSPSLRSLLLLPLLAKTAIVGSQKFESFLSLVGGQVSKAIQIVSERGEEKKVARADRDTVLGSRRYLTLFVPQISDFFYICETDAIERFNFNTQSNPSRLQWPFELPISLHQTRP